MKKLIRMAAGYFAAAMAAGVFYREFTKIIGFEGKTFLSVLHTHLLVLGTLLFLLLALFVRGREEAMESRRFRRFLRFYQISLPFFAGMLMIRGILQVLETPLTRAADAAITGVAGISHILMTLSLFLFFGAIKETLEK